jgi:hypothetical protein
VDVNSGPRWPGVGRGAGGENGPAAETAINQRRAPTISRALLSGVGSGYLIQALSTWATPPFSPGRLRTADLSIRYGCVASWRCSLSSVGGAGGVAPGWDGGDGGWGGGGLDGAIGGLDDAQWRYGYFVTGSARTDGCSHPDKGKPFAWPGLS